MRGPGHGIFWNACLGSKEAGNKVYMIAFGGNN